MSCYLDTMKSSYPESSSWQHLSRTDSVGVCSFADAPQSQPRVFEKAFRQFQMQSCEKGRPAVITGHGLALPCQDWAVDRLAERFGESVACVCFTTDRQTMAGCAVAGFLREPPRIRRSDCIFGFAS